MWPRSTWQFRCLIFSGLVTILGAQVTDELNDPWIHGVYTGKSPRPMLVVENEAWQRANELAGLTPGAFVLIGSGDSMQPLYPSGTILVMQPLPYSALERGETALYRSKACKIVAHVLIAKARDGWRVAGLNNRLHDMEPVQGGNLVGVVIAAFMPLRRGALVRLVSVGQ